MRISLISNPPYNIRWSPPPFAQMQSRFADYGVPPESNANYAFVLTGLDQVTERAVYILPNGALASAEDADIRRSLVESNCIEFVIALPDKMFESTNIPTCIIGLSRAKETSDIMMLDMRKSFEVVIREQRGQYGRKSHTERVYKKGVKVLADTQKALDVITNLTDIEGFSRRVSVEDVRTNGWNVSPARYVETPAAEIKRRPYADILSDINHIIAEKNALKVTINETLAKQLGLYEIALLASKETGMDKPARAVGGEIMRDNYITLTKNKGELSFSNASKENISSILIMILNVWKQHIYYLNGEENRYLIEFRDALLPDLMSGEIGLSPEPGEEVEG